MQSSNSPFMQSYQELPSTVAIFPLSGVVLLPRARLPLNIFEPRYLNMIQDAMQGQRLIGMIQPSSDQSDDLQQVGCAGRITHYAETNDGRLEIILSGLCRFRIAQELPTVRMYTTSLASTVRAWPAPKLPSAPVLYSTAAMRWAA